MVVSVTSSGGHLMKHGQEQKHTLIDNINPPSSPSIYNMLDTCCVCVTDYAYVCVCVASDHRDVIGAC